MAAPPLLNCEALSKQFGVAPLFERLSFSLYEGDRVGLVGPNGSGKSTLLKILAGSEEADAGTRTIRRGVRIGYVPQDSVFPAGLPVRGVLLEALAGSNLEEYEREARAEEVLGRIGFIDALQPVAALSGGWRKRLSIARELVTEPDILLLDEPTNHLDLEGILELEALLKSAVRAFVVVSHDRYFLENVARRMLELDRVYSEGLLQVDGTYSDLLARRDEVRRNQQDYQDSLANRARRELEWLRRGPKARATKAKARSDEAHRLQDELAALKSKEPGAAAGIDFSASARKTKRLLTAVGLEKSFPGRRVLGGVDLAIQPGTRLGVLGANGSGKTTLLALLAGTLLPDAGTIERAPFLKTVWFEQGRESLELGLTLRRALCPDGDSVVYQGRPIHVAAWAKRFLFRTEQLDTVVERLSGGERARILIARLMLQPADLLILDEPTNDLDIPTLEVLEESLLEFPNGMILVTHDRYLLDRVATSILALTGDGGAQHFADIAQWDSSRRAATPRRLSATAAPAPVAALRPPAAKPGSKRLGYQERRELEGIEAAILAAEAALEQRQAAAADPGVATDAIELHARYAALAQAKSEVENLYARWAELESKQRGG
jgi:ABC transport system ATP-binding/permease protein